MGFVEQAHRRRQAGRICQLSARVGERIQVIAYLLNVRCRTRIASRVLCLEVEQVDQRCLRTLNLRRQHRLLADEGVDEPVERRHHLPRQPQSG